ncbi:MAG TPA: DUF1841 family protein [Orrella sp.]
MFNPSREQVRSFFIEAWQKRQKNMVLTPLDTMAADLVEMHPEYLQDLQNPEALTQDYSVEQGRTNPFLHLSMHLAIAEQISIDHPPGIRDAYAKLAARHGEHDAIHEIMECLGQVVWEAQRLGTPLDNDTYLDLLQRRATKTGH